jgi:hypothetical protein
MATADNILTEVYLRVRDTGRTAILVANGLTLLSHAQRAVNIFTKSVIGTQSLTTNASQGLYQVFTDAALIARIDGVRDGTEDLQQMSLQQLWRLSATFFRDTGSEYLAYSYMGRDLLLLYPLKTGASSVTLVGPKQIIDLAATSTTIELKDEHFPWLFDLTELMFLFTLRRLPQFTKLAERFIAKIQASGLTTDFQIPLIGQVVK